MDQNLQQKGKGQNYGWGSCFRDFLIFLVIFTLLFRFILGISLVKGSSMEDTIPSGRIVFFLRTVKDYKTGDVVAARVPTGKLYVKRIVARSGDLVELKDGCLYVNGAQELEGPFQGTTEALPDGISYPYTVPQGSYFLLGDNREHSIDSRAFGAVSEDNMIGRLFGY